MPLISVIVPVYKVEPYLHECVDSILNQTFKDFELILVDDGSPDNCPAICDEYAKKDNRVIVIHKENGGLSSARNAGLDYIFNHSNSEYISFVDSDDYVNKSYLEKLLNSIVDHNCDISICNAYKVDAKTHEKSKLPEIKEEIVVSSVLFQYALEIGYIFTVSWGKIYRRKLFLKNRFAKNRIHEDEFLANKLYKCKYDVCVINEELYYYLSNPSGIMNNKIIGFDAIDWRIQRLKYLDRNVKKVIDSFLNDIFWCLEYKRKESKKIIMRYKLTIRYIKLFFSPNAFKRKTIIKNIIKTILFM